MRELISDLKVPDSLAVADWLKERQPDELCRMLVDYLSGRATTEQVLRLVVEIEQDSNG